jgi:hypothetical protein
MFLIVYQSPGVIQNSYVYQWVVGSSNTRGKSSGIANSLVNFVFCGRVVCYPHGW